MTRLAALLAVLAAVVWAPPTALAATPTPAPTFAAPRDDDPPAPSPADGAPATSAPSTTAAAVPLATAGGTAQPVGTSAARPVEPAGSPLPDRPANPGRSHRPGSDPTTPAAAPAARNVSPGGSPDPGIVDGVDGTSTADLVSILALMLGVATAALLGTGWLITVRDRPKEREAPTAARVAERARRTAAMRLPDDDPVIAALGLGDGEVPRAGAPRRSRGRRGWPQGPPSRR